MRLDLRDFRSYEHARLRLGDGVTVISGRNGAGKTNLLEALYFACTGRSCRTANEREVVRFGAPLCRLELHTHDALGTHVIGVGFQPGEPKRLSVDGAAVERLTDVAARPLVSVFLPDRLDLVLGAPALRRAHLDQVVAALWPSRAATRRSYTGALAQRNALVTAVRAGRGSASSLPAWDAELARHGVELMRDRAEAVDGLRERFARHAEALGLEGAAEVAYRPRSRAQTAEALAAELGERTAGDIDRGFTSHGPHRDELALRRAGRELRAYGSRGQQRLGLLALLLAERELLADVRGTPPLLLLDDVMSELDATRRGRLVDVLHGGGQSVITTTELAHVPGADDARVEKVALADGRVHQGDDDERGAAGARAAEDAAGAPEPDAPADADAAGAEPHVPDAPADADAARAEPHVPDAPADADADANPTTADAHAAPERLAR
jgi:DNA replication and repair protein RecF